MAVAEAICFCEDAIGCPQPNQVSTLQHIGELRVLLPQCRSCFSLFLGGLPPDLTRVLQSHDGHDGTTFLGNRGCWSRNKGLLEKSSGVETSCRYDMISHRITLQWTSF